MRPYSGTCAPDAYVTPLRVRPNVGPYPGLLPRENSCLTTSGPLQMFRLEQQEHSGCQIDDREKH